MHPKDADGIANSVDPDRSSLIWVSTIFSDQGVIVLNFSAVYVQRVLLLGLIL